MEIPAKPEDHVWFKELIKHTPELVSKYGIRGNPVDLRAGLDQIPVGLGELRVCVLCW
jgi:hypothetical protein